MSAPVRAELQVLDRNGSATETIPVQFNPASMTLQMANSTDGGQTRGRQAQQYNGSASTTLSVDLEFDTADEGSASAPVDVRDRTARVRQFVLPGGTESKSAPPRVRFRWGTFELTGVMDSLTEELTYFSTDGVPLRSKLSVSVKEQDSRFEALERGPGANRAGDAPAAGEGGAGGGPIDRLAEALSGETPADFLARNGLAPEAWRALGGALDALGDGIELEAGLGVGFSAGLSLGGGIGVSAGFGAGLDVSLGASLGLSASAGASVGGGVSAGAGAAAGGSASARGTAGLGQGLALSAAGGLSAAAETAKATVAAEGAAATRASFGTPAPPPPAPDTAAAAARAPLSWSATARSLPPAPAPPAPPPPTADARATSFGAGVPLRDRRIAPGATPAGWVVLGGGSDPGTGTRRTVTGAADPWAALPHAPERGRADRAQDGRRPSCGCHRCGGPR